MGVEMQERAATLPLTPMQRGVWLAEQIDNQGQHLVRSALRVFSDIDFDRLQNALDRVVSRHDILRSRFPVTDGVVGRSVRPNFRVPISRIDLTALPQGRRPGVEQQIARSLGGQHFDLAAEPPLTAILIEVARGEAVFWLAVHHLAFDEASGDRFCSELLDFYRGGQTPDVPMSFSDYASWVEQMRIGRVGRDGAAYWQEELRDFEPPLLPTAVAEHFIPTKVNATSKAIRLSAEDEQAVTELCRTCHVTPFVVMLGCLLLLLSRYGAARRVAVSTPVQLRPEGDDIALIGLCLNTVVIHARIDEQARLSHFFADVAERAYEAWNHRFTPFEEIASLCSGRMDGPSHPLLSFVFALQSDMQTLRDQSPHSVEMVSLKIDQPIPGAGLVIMVQATENGGYSLNLQHHPQAAPVDWAHEMLDAYHRILRAVATDPTARIAELALSSAAVGRAPQLLGRLPTVSERFAECCRSHPGRSVVYDPDPVTFAELEQRVEKIVSLLAHAKVRSGSLVALDLRRDSWLVAAQFAVLRLGAGFIPIGADWPIALVREVCASADIVLATPENAGRTVRRDRVVVLSDMPDGVAAAAVPVSPHPEAVAVLFYTSGSTGRPKGVMISHRALDCFIDWASTDLPHDERTLIAGGTPLVFDMSILETILPGTCGFASVMMEGLSSGPSHVLWPRVNWLNTVPTVLRELLNAGNAPPNVGTLTLGGEVLDRSLVAQAKALWPRARTYNCYGPTETTVFSTVARVDEGQDQYAVPPIGPGIAGHDVRVVDHGFNALPPWALGLVVIGGDGVSLGYYASPDETADKFRPDPFAEVPGSRMHLSGDVGFMTPDGAFHFVGRIDSQIKIMGIRIDVAGVEAALREHPSVRDVACFVIDQQSGSPRLAAAVTSGATDRPSASQLREWLQYRVPAAYVPKHIEWCETLPKTASGKVDRGEAQRRLSRGSGGIARLKLTSSESVVLSIWSKVLGKPVTDIDANFFDLGGSSMNIPRLLAELVAAGAANFTIKDLFHHTTVRQQARQLRSEASTPAPLEAPPRAARIRGALARKRPSA